MKLPPQTEPSISEAAEGEWEQLRKWAARLGLPCDPQLDADDPVVVARTEILAHMDRLERRDPAVRVDTLYGFLEDMPWPHNDGASNLFGYENFADSARGGVDTLRRRRQQEVPA